MASGWRRAEAVWVLSIFLRKGAVEFSHGLCLKWERKREIKEEPIFFPHQSQDEVNLS